MHEDTIAAISTPLGEGGIGIIRLSGHESLKIASKIFKPKSGAGHDSLKSHSMVYGHIIDSISGQIIDEVLLCYMRAPRTYTREDVVEINCHGGMIPLRKVLELLLAGGARLAGPGEFSKRAFLNGRLDLAQAEAVIDIIRSKTDSGLKLAVSRLTGELSSKINHLQEQLLRILAKIEANIDFPDDDLAEAGHAVINDTCLEVMEEIKKLVAGAEVGIIYREGIRAAIIGKPNAGKSSLLNALLREKRAIVTDIPGTTRDVIEEIVNIKGIPLRIMDTAGLHETEDLVEKIGIERTKETIDKADLLLLVLDAMSGIADVDFKIAELAENKKSLVLVNKSDVGNILINNEDLIKLAKGRPVLWISAKQGDGLAELEHQITKTVLSEKYDWTDSAMIANLRQKEALEKALKHLDEAVAGLTNMVPVDIVTIDIRGAWDRLGEINGTTVGDDLIDRIFKDFCIGK
ncbi:MAG: tRNA modification GTPase MnmE [Pelotomaculum sp. PtaB.Bin104]|nr:MAG: tRNA modification GTPase MnmE [Pelotomaculum sp. PtaB.Bin104]